jgi:hypothetical protein
VATVVRLLLRGYGCVTTVTWQPTIGQKMLSIGAARECYLGKARPRVSIYFSWDLAELELVSAPLLLTISF